MKMSMIIICLSNLILITASYGQTGNTSTNSQENSIPGYTPPAPQQTPGNPSTPSATQAPPNSATSCTAIAKQMYDAYKNNNFDKSLPWLNVNWIISNIGKPIIEQNSSKTYFWKGYSISVDKNGELSSMVEGNTLPAPLKGHITTPTIQEATDALGPPIRILSSTDTTYSWRCPDGRSEINVSEKEKFISFGGIYCTDQGCNFFGAGISK